MNRDVRSILDELYNQYYNTDYKEKASIQIDIILSQAFKVKPITLFFIRMRNKDFAKTITKLLNGDDVSDIDISLAISSFITHAIIELKSNKSSFFDLCIPELSRALSEYLSGEVDTDYIIDFLQRKLF